MNVSTLPYLPILPTLFFSFFFLCNLLFDLIQFNSICMYVLIKKLKKSKKSINKYTLVSERPVILLYISITKLG